MAGSPEREKATDTRARAKVIADGTTVTLSDYGVCTAGTRLKLYTINGGGHAWPGGESTLFGATTQDISASGLIWRFVAGYRR